MAAADDRVILAGAEGPARRDARLAGPAGPIQRLTVTAQVHRAHLGPARNADPVHGEPAVTDLVTRARNGDKQAWDTLVERYATLVWSICRRYRLTGADIDDIGQTVWLQLVSQLKKLRDPAALPGWLATTTRRECGKVLRATRRAQALGRALDTEHIPDQETGIPEHELLVAERHAALRDAFARLSPCCQRLLALLTADPPVPYAQISARLGFPVGSIGPSRSRCLEKLRRDPAVAALINADAPPTGVNCPDRHKLND